MVRSRGFSLVEVMVCVALLVGMAAVAAQNFLRGARTVKKDAVAALTGEIRAAQQQAIQENKIVALTLVGPNSAKLGWEVGQSEPRLARVRDLSSDFPDMWLNVGTPTQLTSPDPRLSDQWFRAERVALIFTPAGRIFSNLAPDADQAYHLNLVRGGGGQWDIRLQTRGDLRATEISSAVSGQPALDTSLTQSSSANTVPVIQALSVMTSSNEPRDGLGVLHITPAADQLVTFRLDASDPDGDDQLFLEGSGGGRFSSGSPSPMTYDAATQRWVGYLTWQPSGTLSTPTDLHFVVTDRAGSVAADTSNSKVTVDGIASELLVFCDKLQGDQRNVVYRANPDGSGLRPVPIAGSSMDTAGAMLSPNGRMIAYFGSTNWPPSLYVVGVNGGSPRLLASSVNGSTYDIVWSADSSQVYVVTSGGLKRYAAGGGGGNWSLAGFDPFFLVASPDHRKLGYVTKTTPKRVEILELATGTVTTVATETAGTAFTMSSCDSPLCFSEDSNTFFYCVYDGAQNAKIYSFTGAGPATMALDTGGRVIWLRSGPGRKLAYVSMGSGTRPLVSYDDYTVPATRHNVASRSSNSIYAGGPDRLEISRDGNRIYWMQGHDGGSKLMRYDFTGTNSLPICDVSSFYNYPQGNALSLNP